MKKVIAYSLVGAIMLSSCSTADSGASNGAFFGSILGSAIGGISGGHRGSDIGTIVGMAGGAIAGAAIGSANEKKEQKKYEEYLRQRNERYSREYQKREISRMNDESGFDPNNGGDDRIEMEPESPATASVRNSSDEPYTTVEAKTVTLDQLKAMTNYSVNINERIQLRNVSFVDADGNGEIHPEEECKVSFEIMNNSDVEIFDVVPTVIEVYPYFSRNTCREYQTASGCALFSHSDGGQEAKGWQCRDTCGSGARSERHHVTGKGIQYNNKEKSLNPWIP